MNQKTIEFHQFRSLPSVHLSTWLDSARGRAVRLDSYLSLLEKYNLAIQTLVEISEREKHSDFTALANSGIEMKRKAHQSLRELGIVK